MQEHFFILKVGESWKTVPEGQKSLELINEIRREGQAEFFSHHVKHLHSPKDNAMTRYWQYYVGQTIQEHLFILKVVVIYDIVYFSHFFPLVSLSGHFFVSLLSHTSLFHQ